MQENNGQSRSPKNIKFPTGIRRWSASLKQSSSLPHQHFCNRTNTIKLLSSKVEDNKNHNMTSPPRSKPLTSKPPILQCKLLERFQKFKRNIKNPWPEFLCLAQLPERPSEDCSTISASSQNLMFNIQNF